MFEYVTDLFKVKSRFESTDWDDMCLHQQITETKKTYVTITIKV